MSPPPARGQARRRWTKAPSSGKDRHRRKSLVSFTPEFILLRNACRWPPSAERNAAVAAAAARADLARFAALARRHRVEGLAWRALADAGVEAPEGLGRDARDVAARNLMFLSELLRLDAAFGKAGVDRLHLKGLTLAMLAYADPSLKSGSDIDILVAPGAIGEAAEVLVGAGYAFRGPAAPAGGAAAAAGSWHERTKESLWYNEAAGIFVDLHSRLQDNERLIPGLGLGSPRQAVEIAPGHSLETLATNPLFAYLCVHGASSGWFRLKWLADVAALLAPLPPAEIERLHACAQALGAGRAVDQTLLLAAEQFALPLPPGLDERLRSQRWSRWLARAATRMLAAEKEVGERRLGTLPIHLTQLLLLPGLAFKFGELRRQAREAGMEA